ncbi:methyltransferase domain-containing protein [Paradesulfitobacterium ferrireducens]|uniref:methyltransferase domain-containing protein n=1 Tax=Paradesulfitobacterium ferrireducens TaxID=2816476 RepID=UPI001A8C6F0F|nr:methyltransferase domain-containing protein [Paradesulfitobacterium ferrireducens]
MSHRALRVHVLYESSFGGLPHGCGEIRLLRPLSHPALQSDIVLSSGLEMPNDPVDVVIIERFWDYSGNLEQHGALLERLRQKNIRVIFEIDDDLLSLNSESGESSSPTMQQKMWLRWMIKSADGLITSTQNLANRLNRLNYNIEIVPNALDERLFEPSREFREPAPVDRLVFGYMGTLTHLEDLISIVGPLRRVLARHKNHVSFEIVGVGDHKIIETVFRDLPVRIKQVPSNMVSYDKFTDWTQKNLRWDFGIAPLIDSVFTRSKSDIKFLDYGVQGIPGIFSAMPVYQDTVKHMENGLLAGTAEEWEDCLERLISDRDLRLRLGRNVHKEVWTQRMLAHSASNWAVSIRNLLSKADESHKAAAELFSQLTQNAPNPNAPNPNRTRNEKLLYGLNLTGIGLEIGASYSPVVSKKAGFRVEVIDHADAETLREKYKRQEVEIENIEDVDYVWSGEPLNELTGKTDYYDWIIASHVIEHTPDLIAFLQQCEQMLKPGGILALAIPDHRYCFDIFRSVSTPGDVIQAHLEQRKRHTPGAIWDHFSMIVRKGDTVSWGSGHQGIFTLIHSRDEAKFMFEKALAINEYFDVHNWCFTPSSFRLILEDIRVLGFLKNILVQSFFPTVGCEFIVQLKKTMNYDPVTLPANRLDMLNGCFMERCE